MANRPWAISEEEFEQQFAVATQRGQQEIAKGAYAVAARYSKASQRIIVELASGATLMIPAHLIQGLQAASAKDLATIEILGVGSGLYWPRLKTDISVAGLLQGLFGSQSWMSELGKAGGRVSSPAKQAASRANGKRGGRPAKIAA